MAIPSLRTLSAEPRHPACHHIPERARERAIPLPSDGSPPPTALRLLRDPRPHIGPAVHGAPVRGSSAGCARPGRCRYAPRVDGAVDPKAGTLTLNLRLRRPGGRGLPRQLREPYGGPVDVHHDLTAHGPNGFLRAFAGPGKAGTARPEVTARHTGDDVELTFTGQGAGPVPLKVASAHGSRSRTVRVRPGGDRPRGRRPAVEPPPVRPDRHRRRGLPAEVRRARGERAGRGERSGAGPAAGHRAGAAWCAPAPRAVTGE